MIEATTTLTRADPEAPSGSNTFITFNYDTLVEEALTALGVNFTYAFNSKSINTDSSARKVALHDTAPVRVLKLHGSTNWAMPGKRGKKLTVYGSYADIRNQDLVPELIPPTWRKTFSGQLGNIWSTALQVIGEATRLMIIGFSMPETDNHFKYLLAAGLQNNVSLRDITFVNSSVGEMEPRIAALFSETTRKSPPLHRIGKSIGGFLTQGIGMEVIGDFGRPMESSIQNTTMIDA